MSVDWEHFFRPRSIAVIGASRSHHKIGHVILQSLIASHFKGAIYPVNPHAEVILGKKCYPSVLQLPEKVFTAAVAVPASLLLQVVEECGRAGVKALIVVTAGLSETGDKKIEEDLLTLLKKYDMHMIGPNCLGIMEMHHQLDLVFLPIDRMLRPRAGGIGFICQSGAVGSTTLDFMASQGHRISHFISYGNATDLNECDFLEYAHHDPNTKVICMYMEGVRDGRRFLRLSREISKKKPIIAIKGGTTAYGSTAALSHTASLAGDSRIYSGIFKQAGILEAHTIEELFDLAKVFEHMKAPQGRRVQIVTNGGGFGILMADQLEINGMELARLKPKTEKVLKEKYPSDYIVHNPIDLTGAATEEDYLLALQACVEDSHVDIILFIMLFQTPLLTMDGLRKVCHAARAAPKPMLVVSAGSNLTAPFREELQRFNIPVFNFPDEAARALKALCAHLNV